KEYPYGRWLYLDENFALTASAEAMVRFLRRYHSGTGTRLIDPSTGQWAPIPDNGWSLWFGAMSGTWTLTIQRRWDEVSIAVLFNQVGNYTSLVDPLVAIVDRLPPRAWQ